MPVIPKPQFPAFLAPRGPANGWRSSGIESLDAMLGGGFEPGSTWLIEGQPGVGKTLLGLHFLAQGLEQGEAGIYITASEPPSKIVQFLAQNWPQMEKHIASNALSVLDPAPFFTEMRLGKERRTAGRMDGWDEIWHFLQDLTKQSRNQDAKRIVIDPITPLLFSHENTIDLWDATQTLVATLSDNLGATTLLSHVSMPHPVFESVEATLRVLCTGVVRMERHADGDIGLHCIKRRHHPIAHRDAAVRIGAGGFFSAAPAHLRHEEHAA